MFSAVPLSMKKEFYRGETVMTKDKLLASSCDCMSEGDKHDTVEIISSVCVHALPRAYFLTKILSQDFAEHIPLEL